MAGPSSSSLLRSSLISWLLFFALTALINAEQHVRRVSEEEFNSVIYYSGEKKDNDNNNDNDKVVLVACS